MVTLTHDLTMYQRVEMAFTVPAMAMAEGLAALTDEAGKDAFAAAIKAVALARLADGTLLYGMVNHDVVYAGWMASLPECIKLFDNVTES